MVLWFIVHPHLNHGHHVNLIDTWRIEIIDQKLLEPRFIKSRFRGPSYFAFIPVFSNLMEVHVKVTLVICRDGFHVQLKFCRQNLPAFQIRKVKSQEGMMGIYGIPTDEVLFGPIFRIRWWNRNGCIANWPEYCFYSLFFSSEDKFSLGQCLPTLVYGCYTPNILSVKIELQIFRDLIAIGKKGSLVYQISSFGTSV